MVSRIETHLLHTDQLEPYSSYIYYLGEYCTHYYSGTQ